MERNKKIIKISVLGILVNILLVIFKAIVGIIANSIAIILDAVNNLSDALSSIITIIGTVLSGKKPNKKHPYGYGRIEYITSTIIAVIVLLAGISAFKESFIKIIHPEKANYSIVTLIVIIVAMLVKYFFGNFVKRSGEKLGASTLVASGADAINDSFLSFSTLIAAISTMFFNINIDGYVGVIISTLILKAAFEILKDTIDDMIGVRANGEITKKLREKLEGYSDVISVSDLILHNYGPNRTIGTAHIQVRDDMTAQEIHRLTRRISIAIFNTFGIILTLGIYASNDKGEYGEIQSYLAEIIKEYPTILQTHGFYVDEEIKFHLTLYLILVKKMKISY